MAAHDIQVVARRDEVVPCCYGNFEDGYLAAAADCDRCEFINACRQASTPPPCHGPQEKASSATILGCKKCKFQRGCNTPLNRPDGKDTNPKDAVGAKKAPLSCVPAPVLMEVGLAMLEGARKYGRHNYRVAAVRSSVYYDALMRHIMAWWEGQDVDPDSGLPHLTKAMACLVVLRDAERCGKMVDDRPPSVHGDEWVQRLNVLAAGIIDRVPDPKAAFTREDPNGRVS
ncbi:dATP/dGTP diphosphohydrolase domain-containing protein [uncultured Rhodospira sp.]|uniref:dATP/dGTP diphosphohydrolase domain-containing protein n=1 Tax=uncultured Rhodospira sp. TaxID=1936189 RepID=UPI0026168F59|nr:dATP/dGTP diphosphohydrolase domain-containing protein [uncultured Rhodospira sp.]